MKIIPIFAPSLFAFKFDQNEVDEYSFAMDNWNNNIFLKKFYEDNFSFIDGNKYFPVSNVEEFVIFIRNQAARFDDALEALSLSGDIEDKFEILSDGDDIYEILPFVKGKQLVLRLYGINLGGTITITGSAIKLSHKMKEHSSTAKQKQKLYSCQDFLKDNSINDEETFFDFLIEQSNE